MESGQRNGTPIITWALAAPRAYVRDASHRRNEVMGEDLGFGDGLSGSRRDRPGFAQFAGS